MTGDLKRILYVEDETDIRTIAVTVLEAIGGFTVIACSSGAQALEAAPAAAADLILLDVMMPGMDGPTTLKALRAVSQTATTPVIFMTAKVQPNEIEYFRSLGALDVIPKPFDPMTLTAQIAEIWQRRPQPGEQDSSRTAAQSTENALQALYKKYADDLPGTIGNIEELWSGLVSGGDPQALKALHRALHSLAGSGETFGYTQLGKIAREMEFALEPHLKETVIPSDLMTTLSATLDRLKQAAGAPD